VQIRSDRTRENIDHATYCIGAVEGGCTAVKDLYARNIIEREQTEINQTVLEAGKPISINQHEDVFGC
jgi:hypothetical protein